MSAYYRAVFWAIPSMALFLSNKQECGDAFNGGFLLLSRAVWVAKKDRAVVLQGIKAHF